MGVWLYAYFIPHDHDRFAIEEPLHHLINHGLKLDPTAMTVQVADEEGHCEPVGDELSLGETPMESVDALLATGHDLLLEFRDKNLWLTYVSAIQGANPHVTIGWSRRIFDSLKDEVQWSYLTLFEGFARESRAAAVVIVEEPPGYFEDRFLFSNNELLIDATPPGRYGIGIREVWLRQEATLGIQGLEGMGPERCSAIGSFQRYKVP